MARVPVALVCALLFLAGCAANPSSDEADEPVAETPSGADDPSPPPTSGSASDPPPATEPAPPAAKPGPTWINGTFQSVGQCIVWPQEEIDGVDWHDLPDGPRGRAYETEVEARVGPAPTLIGPTGVCMYFADDAKALGSRPLSGTVPDGATRVAVMTDAAIGGSFAMRIDPA